MVGVLRWLWVFVGTLVLGWFFWTKNLYGLHIAWQGLVWGMFAWEVVRFRKKGVYFSFSSILFFFWTVFFYLVYGKQGILGIDYVLFLHMDTYNLLVLLTLSILGIWLVRNSGLVGWMARTGWKPYMVILSSFMVLIWIGTVLLMFPFSHTGRSEVSLVDALFTATSAVCVTGLTVLDTAKDFSFLGQLVILSLIQLGGLGLIVFAAAFTFMIGQKLSLQGGVTLANALGTSSFKEVRVLVRSILVFTVGWELLGALVLFMAFVRQMPVKEAMYYSVFHSISAFCNAGFSLFPDSSMSFRKDPLILLTVGFLVIFGGLGFAVMRNIWEFLKAKLFHSHKKTFYLRIHTRIVLLMTVCLIFVGTLAVFFLEYYGQLAGLSLGEKLLNAFFAALTPRTAGFNSIDYAQVKYPTLFLTMVLMFIGASPGSTGGGIKTTTLFLLLANTYHVLRDALMVRVWDREVPFENVRKAYLIFVMSLLWLVVVFFGLLVIEKTLPFERLFFELVSAFGTVGLSTGVTSSLSPFSKVLIILTMFLGRVGPLALFYGIGISAQKIFVRYLKEDVMIG